MKQRHWDRIENVTKCKFEPFSENFLLRHIMEAPLLQNKDDLEDICISSGRFQTSISQNVQVWVVPGLIEDWQRASQWEIKQQLSIVTFSK